MKQVTVSVTRFGHTHGWANRISRIDLSNMTIGAQEAAPYVPDYLGARGIAARIAWDEYPEPVGEFEPANPLMIFPGALTGSRSPYSGRTNVCAFSPQGYPYPWFTRSSIGGRFGGELKRAGYDGIVVTGASETPVQVRIRDDEVSVLPADDVALLEMVTAGPEWIGQTRRAQGMALVTVDEDEYYEDATARAVAEAEHIAEVRLLAEALALPWGEGQTVGDLAETNRGVAVRLLMLVGGLAPDAEDVEVADDVAAVAMTLDLRAVWLEILAEQFHNPSAPSVDQPAAEQPPVVERPTDEAPAEEMPAEAVVEDEAPPADEPAEDAENALTPEEQAALDAAFAGDEGAGESSEDE